MLLPNDINPWIDMVTKLGLAIGAWLTVREKWTAKKRSGHQTKRKR